MRQLRLPEKALPVLVLRPKYTDRRQIAVRQHTPGLQNTVRLLDETKLMRVLLFLAVRVRVIQDPIKRVIRQGLHHILPQTKHWRHLVRLLLRPLLQRLEHIRIRLDDHMLRNVLPLDRSRRDRQTKPHLQHLTTLLGCDLGKTIHVRSLPALHHRVPLDLQTVRSQISLDLLPFLSLRTRSQPVVPMLTTLEQCRSQCLRKVVVLALSRRGHREPLHTLHVRFHKSAFLQMRQLRLPEKALPVLVLRPKYTDRRQIAVRQHTPGLQNTVRLLDETKLMRVLLFLAVRVRVIQDPIKRVIRQGLHHILPQTKHWRHLVRLLLRPLLQRLEHIRIRLDDHMLRNVLPLDRSRRDRQTKPHLQHLTTLLGCDLGKTIHVRSLPALHHRVPLDLQTVRSQISLDLLPLLSLRTRPQPVVAMDFGGRFTETRRRHPFANLAVSRS